jgi:uncharacterized protein
MMQISPTTARRLAISRQRLAGTTPLSGTPAIMDVLRDLGCLQLDPTSAVARSHLLVLWSRLGLYNPADLDKLLWEDRALFEYWAHAASIVLTEDYPIHYQQMRAFAASNSSWGKRVQKWVEQNTVLRDHIMEEITLWGPLPSKHFIDKAEAGWYSSGWTSTRNVSQMLGILWDMGVLMVASRKGGHRFWDLTERCLPAWTPRESLDWPQVVRRAALKSLRALGVGTPRHIQQHFTRSRYPGLTSIVKALESESLIVPLEIVEDGKAWPGSWYVHCDDLPLLKSLEAGDWQPRTTLLSPFDNLICDRARTELLFNFEFRIEIYVPKDKRRYGYFVLPILHGDRLIGRVDPLMDRKQSKLMVNAVYAEPDAPMNRKTAQSVAGAIESLATFLGAKTIEYTGLVPDGWKSALG